MPIKTTLCEVLDIEHPLILAPMAGVSGGKLAAAVSRAGGLGLIGGGYGDAEWIKREFSSAGNAKVGVGFITWSLARQPKLLDLALDYAPASVMLSFGDVGPFIERIRRTPAKLIVQIQTLEQAREAIANSVDVIVAQGTEAGGHGGSRSTLPLVPAVVDIAGNVPVVAAGGIADGRGLAAALVLGAAGVLCGTAFYASSEALSHDCAKWAAVAGTGDNTERSSVFDIVRELDWPADWNLRTLRNNFTTLWSDDHHSLRRNLEQEQARFERARTTGDTDVAPVIVGEGIDLVRSSEPAGEIVSRISTEAEQFVYRAESFIEPAIKA